MIVRRIAANTIALLAGKVLCGLLSLASLVVLARSLGVVAFGAYTYAQAIVSIFSLICLFGLDTVLIREISQQPSSRSRLLGSGFFIRSGIGLACFGLSVGISWIVLAADVDTWNIAVILSIPLLLSPLQLLRAAFEALLKSHYPVLADLLARGLGFCAICWLAREGGTVEGMAWATVGAEAAGSIFLLGFAWGRSLLNMKPDRSTCWWLMREAWPVAVASLSGVIYFRIDAVLIGVFRGNAEVAYYNCAYSVMSALMFIPEAFSRSLYPVMSEAYHLSKGRMAFIVTRAFKYLVTMAVPVATLGALLAPGIVRMLYGASFEPAQGALRVLSVSAGVVFVSYLVSTSINAMGQQRVNMFYSTFCAVFNIVLNLAVIPRWGFLGASWTTLLTEAAGCSLALAFNCRVLQGIAKETATFRSMALFASIPMMALLCGLLSFLHVLLLLSVNVTFYLLFLLSWKWFDKTDKDLFLQSFRGDV